MTWKFQFSRSHYLTLANILSGNQSWNLIITTCVEVEYHLLKTSLECWLLLSEQSAHQANLKHERPCAVFAKCLNSSQLEREPRGSGTTCCFTGYVLPRTCPGGQGTGPGQQGRWDQLFWRHWFHRIPGAGEREDTQLDVLRVSVIGWCQNSRVLLTSACFQVAAAGGVIHEAISVQRWNVHLFEQQPRVCDETFKLCLRTNWIRLMGQFCF